MEKKEIARRIAKFNIKYPFPEPKEDWGPYASVPMYRWMRKEKYGKIVWTTYKKWFGSTNTGSVRYDEWDQRVAPPKCLWGMIAEIDEFVGLIRMYEIRLDVPDLRVLKNVTENIFWSTKLIWKKQDFEIYIDIKTSEIYDKNGNHIRKSDRVFPSVTLDRVDGEYSRITAIHRRLVAFKDMQQFYTNHIDNIRAKLYDMGYDTTNMKSYRSIGEFNSLVVCISQKLKMFSCGDIRTYIEKRNAFCSSWGEYRRSEGKRIIKIPEQYNGKNVYKISFSNEWWRTPVIYIIGKNYCIYSSTGCKDKMRISDLSSSHFVNKHELSIFSGDPEIGWVANMEGNENGNVNVDDLLKNISNIFYEQLTKMNLLGLRRADRILHGGARRTGNVLKHYGISKKQAVMLSEYFANRSWLDKRNVECVFNTIRGFFSFSETISGEKDFEEVFKQMRQCDKQNLDFIEQEYLFRTNEPIATIPPVERKIIMDQKKKILRFCAEERSPLEDTVRMYMKYTNYVATGEDYCRDWENRIPKAFWLEVTPNIHSAADFSRTHDLYMERCREIDQRAQAQRDADLQRKFAKYEEDNKKRKEKWEFTNEKFAVVFPMTVSEVRLEGEALHHCVGGYAQRHIQNETTILFLRKEELPETAFYTIEIRKDGTEWKVVQVHGACNKWVGNDPEAAVFLYRYFKAHDVVCDNNILLSTASGYWEGNATKLDPSILTDED